MLRGRGLWGTSVGLPGGGRSGLVVRRSLEVADFLVNLASAMALSSVALGGLQTQCAVL